MSGTKSGSFLSQLSPGARLFLGMGIGDAFGSRFENLRRDSIHLEGEEGIYHDKKQIY